MSPSATALVVPIALALALTSARASPCSDEIASLETAINASESSPTLVPTEPQSLGAQLHHQPTTAVGAARRSGAEHGAQ
jgi:hypothetical protein